VELGERGEMVVVVASLPRGEAVSDAAPALWHEYAPLVAVQPEKLGGAGGGDGSGDGGGDDAEMQFHELYHDPTTKFESIVKETDDANTRNEVVTKAVCMGNTGDFVADVGGVELVWMNSYKCCRCVSQTPFKSSSLLS
jgi:hypothetical protein